MLECNNIITNSFHLFLKFYLCQKKLYFLEWVGGNSLKRKYVEGAARFICKMNRDEQGGSAAGQKLEVSSGHTF